MVIAIGQLANERLMLPLGEQPELLPGLPVKVAVEFDNVPVGVTSGTLVIEADRGYLGREMTVIFPNVALGAKGGGT